MIEDFSFKSCFATFILDRVEIQSQVNFRVVPRNACPENPALRMILHPKKMNLWVRPEGSALITRFDIFCSSVNSGHIMLEKFFFTFKRGFHSQLCFFE